MPENNHEVIIDGYVYPDTVTITLANDDFVGSRDYVDKDLYESVSGANDFWQAENAKLREESSKYHDLYVHAITDAEVWHLQWSAEHQKNAKLRELARDMLPFAEVGMDDTCVARRCCLFEECGYVVGAKCAIEQHMLDRMRELGIEAE